MTLCNHATDMKDTVARFVSITRPKLAPVLFLDASSHLYKRVCPSVRGSVGPSVRPSVTLLFRISENAWIRLLWWRGCRGEEGEGGGEGGDEGGGMHLRFGVTKLVFPHVARSKFVWKKCVSFLRVPFTPVSPTVSWSKTRVYPRRNTVAVKEDDNKAKEKDDVSRPSSTNLIGHY